MNESSSSTHSRSHIILESESSSNWKSPITPTTTRKFNRMAIHGVLEGPNHPPPHPLDDGSRSPPYKRKGSPDEFSDPPSSRSHPGSSFAASGAALRSYDRPSSHHHSQSQGRYAQQPHAPHSPRYRQESPMPASNSEDEEEDLRYKKRRLASSSSSSSSKTHSHPHHLAQQVTPPSPANPNGGSEVMDQLRTTLKLKQQQKAIIESRQQATPTSTSPPTSQPKSSSSSPSSQPVTEKNPSGISVFHGSASFAAMNRRPLPLTSPKNPKNAKSLTIFAPSYSESSLSIQSAPLQPSHGHGRPLGHSHLPHALNHHPMSSMNPRTSQPLGHHKPHPFSQSQATPRSPTKLSGHAKKASRGLLRQPNHDHSNSGTLPAPILSSHTGPLPSPMYPPPHHAHPSTPFLPHHHSSSGPATSASSKHVFMETISGLYDSVDSTKSLKYTLEEQIRKSAQLLQTLQASGTMIESLVRGQFKELEKGVIERFENELEHLAVRVKALEEHQGLTTPPAPKKARTQAPTPSSSSMTGVTSTARSGSPSPSKVSNNGTLPTPPLSKTQEEALSSSTASPMEVEDDESVTTPPREKSHSTEYHSSVKKLQERVADLEKKNSRPTSEASTKPVASS
ncbi:hypothetical protein BG005_002265 [Podila minutissima]|nr:hypothetical protein BG005_002265 [Podila minutissima]